MGSHADDNVDGTVAAYEAGVEAYLAAYSETPSIESFRRAVARHLRPGARILELGSGPGGDAAFFESQGFSVARTDATRGFVERLRSEGHEARVLDVTTDEFGSGFDAVYANAVLLHLTREQFSRALAKAARCVTAGGCWRSR